MPVTLTSGIFYSYFSSCGQCYNQQLITLISHYIWSVKALFAKLQKAQNVLSHIVFRFDRMKHATAYLEKFIWLPISYYTSFKYNLLIFKAINFCQL